MLIYIDAGHGVYTSGKRCLKSIDPKETREWVLNSRIADKLQALLAGYDCETLRADDPTGELDISLADRVSAANAAKADAYLSIHHNAGINGGSGGGTVVFRAEGSSARSKALQEAVYRETVARTGLAGNRSDPTPEKSFYVVKYTSMPAVLIECGFMDSTTDTPIILTEDFAGQVAEGLAAALAEVFGLEEKERKVKYCEKSGAHVVAVPVEDFRLELVDRAKKSCGADYCNAGFFAGYDEGMAHFTLPVAHLACDYKAAGAYTKKYCTERGTFAGEKWRFDSSKWSYQNPYCGKAVSTLVIQGGKARIEDTVALPECDYAVSGVPVLRNGQDVTFATYVQGQGWDGSTLYATWHTFAALTADPSMVYLVGLKTTSSNMIRTAEAYKKLKALGFVDAIKLDGGGSFILNVSGKVVASTTENRQINTIIRFGGMETNPYREPSTVLGLWGKNTEGNKWLQWALTGKGHPCGIDGIFGYGTLAALKAFQKAAGLTVDGLCGPATREKLRGRA